jgi:hypothetical protein
MAESRGRRASAREYYLHASCCYAVAYHPIYGKPVDPRLVDSFHRQMAVLRLERLHHAKPSILIGAAEELRVERADPGSGVPSETPESHSRNTHKSSESPPPSRRLVWS